MSIQAIKTYQTPDGKLFLSEIDAAVHARRAEFADRAERYVRDKQLSGGPATRAANTITEFLAWEAVTGDDDDDA